MKKSITLLSICGVLLSLLMLGCDQKPLPIKEGVIWSVSWTESPTIKSGLHRITTPLPGRGGSYGVDMYGVLYPTCLEVRFVGSKDSHAQIIPMSQIVWLEFGDGGVSIAKH